MKLSDDQLKIFGDKFADLDLQGLWCAYYDGIEDSKRVQEKCGFKPHHTLEKVYVKRNT